MQCYMPVWMGGEFGGRMDTWKCMDESLHRSPETITKLLVGSTPIQNKKVFLKVNGMIVNTLACYEIFIEKNRQLTETSLSSSRASSRLYHSPEPTGSSSWLNSQMQNHIFKGGQTVRFLSFHRFWYPWGS